MAHLRASIPASPVRPVFSKCLGSLEWLVESRTLGRLCRAGLRGSQWGLGCILSSTGNHHSCSTISQRSEFGISLVSCFGTVLAPLQCVCLAFSTGPRVGFGVQERVSEELMTTALGRVRLKAGEGRH